jgi:hypothetical protein
MGADGDICSFGEETYGRTNCSGQSPQDRIRAKRAKAKEANPENVKWILGALQQEAGASGVHVLQETWEQG